jgi:spermidine synthase
VPLYESNLAAMKSEIATFFSVFGDGTVWSNDEQGDGYDVLLLGSAGSTVIDLDRLQQRLARDDYRAVRDSMRGAGYRSGAALLATFAGRAKDLAPWLKDAQLNLDRNLRLEYLAGLGLNYYEQRLLYADLEVHLQFPEDLFAGTAFERKVLRDLFERRHPTDE